MKSSEKNLKTTVSISPDHRNMLEGLVKKTDKNQSKVVEEALRIMSEKYNLIPMSATQ